MTSRSTTGVRHCVRPLSVYSFCGETITLPLDKYHSLSRNLPLCPKCQLARDHAAVALGGKYRRLW